MVKSQVTIMIDRDVLRRVEELREKHYPGASRSFVIELLVRRSLPPKEDIAVVR